MKLDKSSENTISLRSRLPNGQTMSIEDIRRFSTTRTVVVDGSIVIDGTIATDACKLSVERRKHRRRHSVSFAAPVQEGLDYWAVR